MLRQGTASRHRRTGEHKVLLGVILSCAVVGALVIVGAAGYGTGLLAIWIMHR